MDADLPAALAREWDEEFAACGLPLLTWAGAAGREGALGQAGMGRSVG